MTRYADLASDLLKEAANFFIRISEGNPEAKEQMLQNAGTFQHMADLIREDPEGSVEHLSHAEMAARLMEDASKFFETIAQGNEPIREQMLQNSLVFGELAKHVRENPTAEVPPSQVAE